MRIDLTTLRVLIRTIYRDSNGEQGRNLNTSDRLTMHTWWESIWCRKNSTSCHNVMNNTEIMQILTLRVQIQLSLRHHLKVVSLASIGQPKMWMSSSMISLQPYICIMHVVISDNIIINNNNFINLLQGLLTYKSWSMKKKMRIFKFIEGASNNQNRH